MTSTELSPEMEKIRKKVEETAHNVGLDFFPVQFHMLEFTKLNEVIANLGFPKRYVHWRFGMEYGKLMKELGFGFGRVYEMVINTNPAIAYLLSYNQNAQQTMVMAHVYAHVDFFKNNMAFAATDRNMLNTMAEHAELLGYYYEKHGFVKVEEFIDACLSIEHLVDPFFDKIAKKKEDNNNEQQPKDETPLITVQPYLEDFVKDMLNPKKPEKKPKNVLVRDGDRDVLQFIIDTADHLKGWQKDILSIIREERCYFIPQMQTKIMNEGWATFWHSYLMSQKGIAGDAGICDYAKTHAGVVGSLIPSKGHVQLGFNPYTLGFLLFKDIKERWDKGRYGVDYENERDMEKKEKWDTGEMNGLKKIFEVRKFKTDIGFVREFFTDEFIRKHLFFMYGADSSGEYDIIKSLKPERIRKEMLNLLTNYGEPVIEAVDANFKNTGSLLLRHVDEGLELHPYYTEATLRNIFKIWQRPVFLITRHESTRILYRYNGEEIRTAELSK